MGHGLRYQSVVGWSDPGLLAERGSVSTGCRSMAAVGFAGLLVVILKSGAVQGMLTDLVHRALTVAG